MSIIVLGIGHRFQGDDSVGLEIVQHWDRSYKSPVGAVIIRREVLENPGITLLTKMLGFDTAILVEGLQTGTNPGTLHQIEENQLDTFYEDFRLSKIWETAETLALGRTLQLPDLPDTIFILGIEITQTELGSGLSPQVNRAIPEAVGVLNQLLSDLSPG